MILHRLKELTSSMADKALATHRSREQDKYDMQHIPATVPLSNA